jgi:hypothetical protein
VSKTSRSVLGLNKSPIKWVLWGLFVGTKKPDREADRSSEFSVEIKNECGCFTKVLPVCRRSANKV